MLTFLPDWSSVFQKSLHRLFRQSDSLLENHRISSIFLKGSSFFGSFIFFLVVCSDECPKMLVRETSSQGLSQHSRSGVQRWCRLLFQESWTKQKASLRFATSLPLLYKLLGLLILHHESFFLL